MKKQITINQKEITLAGLKSEIARMENSIDNIKHIRNSTKELNGIIGKDEYSSIYWKIFDNPKPLDNEQEFKQELENILTQSTYTMTTYPFQAMNDLFDKYIPIEDNRETQEERDKKNQEYEKAKQEREQEREQQEKEIDLGTEETITRKENEMIITIQAYFNDSDMMTDYFNSHCPLSNTYAIKKVHKQPKREKLARDIIENIQELKDLKWEWHIEEYAMGHGTYLQSQPVGTIKQNAYDGRDEVAYWYEIHFNKYTNEIKKSKWYNESKATKQEPSENGQPTITENKDKQGIEIYFNTKPSDETLDTLKENGFRWGKYNKCWYIKNSQENQTRIETVKKYLK